MNMIKNYDSEEILHVSVCFVLRSLLVMTPC